MSYSTRRKLGIRKVEKAAGEIGVLHQRLSLMEQIVIKLLERDNLALAMVDGAFALIPSPSPALEASNELTVTYEDEPEVNLPLTPAPEND